MIQPQVLNLSSGNDVYIAVDGYNVIDSNMVELSGSLTFIEVTVHLQDLATGSSDNKDTILMYDSDTDFWNFHTADIAALLKDRHKYVGRIVIRNGGTSGMLPIKIQEFAVDNDSFEAVTMRLPFEVVIGPISWIKWYAVDDISGTVLFKALAYQGGVGTTPATDPSRVTHRGPIVAV